MKKHLKKTAITCLSMLALQVSHAQYNYPASKELPVVDDYFGTKITDNYRWLEDLKAPEVQTWFKAQADYSNGILSKISNTNTLYNDMVQISSLKKADYNPIGAYGNKIFYSKTLAAEKVGKLYYRDLPNGNEILLFDPEKYKDGEVYSINGTLISNDGKMVALGLAKSGAEVGECRIINVETKKLYPEILSPNWGGADAWTKDNSAILYTKLNTADNTSMDMLTNSKVMLHKIQTDTANDILFASREKYSNLPIKPENYCSISFSSDYKYIFMSITSVKNELLTYYAPASEFENEKINWKPLFKFEDEITDFRLVGNKLFMLTHKNAPKFKITVTDINNINITTAKVVIPEGKETIARIRESKNFLFYTTSNGVSKKNFQINLSNYQVKKINIPKESTSWVFALNPLTDICMAGNIGYLTPTINYDYNPISNKISDSKFFKIDGQYNKILSPYTIKEVEVKGHDGTMIPLTIVCRKDVKLDGTNICFMDGYGSYGISNVAFFWEPFMALLNKNVVLAFTHVRGGGELGEAWHTAGQKTTKPNTWKDFISCGEYLIKQGYTTNKKLIGHGMSAGGILIGRAITERPDLFGVAIDEVGATNTIRFEQSPNGPGNIPEFGTTKDTIECKALIEMDAQSHVKKGVQYPAVLVRTGMNDPRVSPWEPGKFAATLQNNSASKNPVLFMVDYDNGHFTEDKTVMYKDFSKMFAFCLWQCGHPDFKMQ